MKTYQRFQIFFFHLSEEHLAFKCLLFQNYAMRQTVKKGTKQLFCLAITGFKWSDVPLNG